MTTVGRPVERPTHLSEDEHRRAQAQTAQWRQQAGLSQQQMAREVGAGHSTYRMWETGKDSHAGPTRLQAGQLDTALRRLLPGQYAEGQAYAVWGWPPADHISYEKTAELLRSAGFAVPGARPGPQVMFWVHRLREPNLVHAVFALAAAAAQRAGVTVRLLLDDSAAMPGARTSLRAEFESQVRAWQAFAGGDDARLSVALYSEILTPPLLAEQGWAAAERYLSSGSVLDYLLASKAVAPLQYSTDAEQSVLELVRQGADSLKAARLLTPLRNWMVFDAELARLAPLHRSGRDPAAIRPSPPAFPPVATLGAEDERLMWELWHRGAAAESSVRVQHIYLRPAPLPNYRVPWQEHALAARTSRTWLAEYLRKRAEYDRHLDLMEWFLQAAVAFPAKLNSAYRASVEPALLEPNPLEQMSAAHLANSIGRAVVGWVNPSP